MYRILLSLILVSSFSNTSTAQDHKDIEGSWIAEVNRFSSLSSFEEASMTMKWTTDGERYRYTFSIPLDQLQEYSNEQGEDGTAFTLDREAGELVFSGSLESDVGAGNFSFTPSPEFLAEMSSLGYKTISPDEQLKMTLYDVTTSFVKRVRSLEASTES